MKGHLKERSPGHWAIILDIPDPATGKRRRKWHSFKGTKRAAQNECAKLISELNGDGYLDPVLTVKATMPDGRVAEHTLNARLEPPLPRPLEAAAVTVHIAKGRRFTLKEVVFSGLLAMKEQYPGLRNGGPWRQKDIGDIEILRRLAGAVPPP